MSDPVTNAEVEDVLSSIRRLVSEDKRPMQAQKPAPASDKLVLTPALRVAETKDEEPQEAPLTLTPDLQAQPQPDHDDASDRENLDAFLERAQGDGAADDSALEDSLQEEAFDDPAFEDDAEELDVRTADYAQMAEAGRAEDDYSADPYGFDDDSRDADDVEADRRDASDEVQAEASEKDSDASSPEDHERAAVLSAKIEALETAIGNISDNWEPDDPGTDDYSGTAAPAMAWEDDESGERVEPASEEARYTSDPEEVEEVAFEEVTTAPEAEPVGADFDDVVKDFSPEPEEPEAVMVADSDQEGADLEDVLDLVSEDQLIDEEMLRDMVSEIVRAELQGPLGERITRNVRKLVRREIHRALTAQELQ